MKACYGCGKLFSFDFLFFACLYETRHACLDCLEVVKTMPTETVKKLEIVRDTFYTASFEDQQFIQQKCWREYQIGLDRMTFDPQELKLLLEISQKIPRPKMSEMAQG